MRELVRRTLHVRPAIHIPAGALAQAWRGSPRQAVLAALLKEDNVRVWPLDEPTARAAGELCARHGTADVVDAQVALCAANVGGVLVTSDPIELRHLAPGVAIEPI